MSLEDKEEEPQISESTSDSDLDMSGCRATERHIILQRISSQLVALDREESTESINCKRLELKRVWNSAVLIHTLSDELLIHIFVNLQADPRGSWPEPSSRSTSGVVGASPITVWHGLMLVCSYWRNLLVETPAFWRAVETERHAEWTKLCLYRSAAASLDVYASIWDGCGPDTLYPHVHRFQKLFFSAGSSESQMQVVLSPLLGGGMPLLEHLDFSTGLGQRPSVNLLDPYVTSHQFPRLQTLALQRAVSPGDKLLYAQLRALSLNWCFHNFTFDGFLDVLAGCAQLEELTLDNTLHNFSNEWTHRGTIPHRQPITLPSLRKFCLNESMSSTIPHFLAHFHTPMSTSLQVTSNFRLDSSAEGFPGADTMKVLSTLLPPNHSETLPILSLATRIVTASLHGCWHTTVYHQYPSGTVDPPGPRRKRESSHTVFMLNSIWDTWADQHSWVGRGLGDLVECFRRSPITLLELYEDDDRQTSVADWEKVFRTFSLLEELIVHSGAELSKVFLGLHAASSRACEDSSLACLNLKHVLVAGCGSTMVTYEAMRECFQRRAAMGARLKVLDLRRLRNNDLTLEERYGYVEDLCQMVWVEFNYSNAEQTTRMG